MDEPQLIVYLETEYGLRAMEGEPVEVITLLTSLNEVFRRRHPSLKRIQQRPGRFLQNGGLIVLPMMEAAHTGRLGRMRWVTPECLSGRELTLYEQAGDRLFTDILTAVREQLPNQAVVAWKNNHDSTGQVVPCYEHYLYRSSLPEERIIRYLLPFLVSRPILCGAGALAEVRNPETPLGGLSFELSQRARDIRALLTRDAETTDCLLDIRPGYIGIFGGDSNMSEAASLLKFGTTLAVIELILADRLPFALNLDNPLSALRTISGDVTFQIRLAQSVGPSVSAIEIQERFLEAAQSYFSSSRDPSIRVTLTAWEQVLTDLKAGRFDLTTPDWSLKKKLMDRLLEPAGGWGRLSPWIPVIKKIDASQITVTGLTPGQVLSLLRQRLSLRDFNELERYMASQHLTWDGLSYYCSLYYRLKLIDLQYHELDRDRGLFYRLLDHGGVTPEFSEAELLAALSEPPMTRARLRGEFVRVTAAREWSARADWEELQVVHPPWRLEISDPWSTKRDDLAALLTDGLAQGVAE